MTPILIGLAGRAGSGKDTVGAIIRTHFNTRGYGTQLLSFAGPLKKICQEVYDFSDRQMTVLEEKNAPDMRYPRADGTFLTPREAMQKLGSEWGRACYPGTWVDYGIRLAEQAMYPTPFGIWRNVVFTDVRFINEAKAIRNINGQVWRIRRPEADAVPASHLSETEMDSEEFWAVVDYWVLNNGSLEHLVGAVKALLP